MDGSNKLGLLKAVAPKMPGIMAAAASHGLGIAETSSKWDLKTALIMATIRSFMSPSKPSPVEKSQKLSVRDPGIKGPMWISKQVLPASAEDASDVLQHLTAAIDSLSSPGSETKYDMPAIRPVAVEWTGSRPGVGKNEARLNLDEDAQYEKMMADVTSDTTVLYIHGGALYLMDPASHRITVARLAKHIGGRCMSIRYRLAPQNPFPAALLDCFIAYVSLLSPPPGAIHAAVPADKIVVAGDSAGGNLSLALLQLILQMHRQSGGNTPSVRFHGKDVFVPIPAGLALQSPWADITRSLPSNTLNVIWDYLPPPPPDMQKVYQPDAIWPSKPPRGDLYCEAAMMLHPLISPLAAKDWKDAPPLFMCIGQEGLADEAMVLARRFNMSGALVELWQFEAMPHVFPAIFADLPGAISAMEKWAHAIARMTSGGKFETVATWVQAKTLYEKILNFDTLASQLAEEDVDRKMADARAKRELEIPADNRVSARL